MTFKVPEKFRVTSGRMRSDSSYGNNGAFEVTVKTSCKQSMYVIASDGMGWEHVSVSRKDRCPTWEEMCKVKELFWDEEDTVLQFHPPKSEYVNNHPFCLHMWRKIGENIETPFKHLVGI